MVLVRHTPGKGRPRAVRGHGGGERLGAWAAALVRALVLLAWAGAASNPAQAQAQVGTHGGGTDSR